MKTKLSEHDIIANRIVKELPDAYDKIMDIDMVKSIGEAVFVSAPEIFDRTFADIEVTGIFRNKVEFKFANWDFTIEKDGIKSEKRDSYDLPKAELLPMFGEALNIGLHQVEISEELENRNHHSIDDMISQARESIKYDPDRENPNMLPADIIL